MSVDTYEADRPEHEVEIRTLAHPEIVEISADVESDVGHAELLRMLADYLDSQHESGVLLSVSCHWGAEEDRWILLATIDH